MSAAVRQRGRHGPGHYGPGHYGRRSPLMEAGATARPLRLRTLGLPFMTEKTEELPQAPTAEAPAIEAPLAEAPVAEAPAIEARLAQQALVKQLAREVQRIETSGTPSMGLATSSAFSTGCQALDRCLPGGGYDSGTVVEYLQAAIASGATSLALTAAREAMAKTDRFCLVVDWREQFYPPAAAALGIDLKRVVIVRPQTLAERLWAIDQALRSPAIVAVIAEVEHMDDRAARRLQLAAERGGGLGLLVRGAAARHHPSWAAVQWLVRPLPQSACRSSGGQSSDGQLADERWPHRQLEIELMRARGVPTGVKMRVQINAIHGRIESATSALANSALANTLRTPPQKQANKAAM